MKDKLAEEIRKVLSQIVMGEYADGTPYYFGDETGQEMEEAIKLLMPLFPAYHKAKMKEVTDEDIEAFADKFARADSNKSFERGEWLGIKEGVRAMRDGEIKHIEK